MQFTENETSLFLVKIVATGELKLTNRPAMYFLLPGSATSKLLIHVYYMIVLTIAAALLKTRSFFARIEITFINFLIDYEESVKIVFWSVKIREFLFASELVTMVTKTSIIEQLGNHHICLLTVKTGNSVKTQLQIKGSLSLDRMFKKVIYNTQVLMSSC